MQLHICVISLCLFLNTPGQTDMPVEGLEATVKAITLIEDFTAFDAPLPDLRYRAAFYTLTDTC